MRISLDTETTGLDLRHGALPFLVTMCDDKEETTFWEWDVDPFTRIPIVPVEDLKEIQSRIDDAEEIALQNAKFDHAALTQLFRKNRRRLKWYWEKVRDTLMSGHLLASNQPHDLTTMALVYLGVNIQPYEEEMKAACKEARRLAGSKAFIEKHGQWRIAKKGLPEMPSAKEETWKFDMWLPRAIAKAEGYDEDHPWWTVTSTYANWDSSVTLPLHDVHLENIQKENLEPIYDTRMQVIPVVTHMESRGITANREKRDELLVEYTKEIEACGRKCKNLSGGRLEEIPSGVTNNLRSIIFDYFKLVSPKKTDTGNPSLDSSVLDGWIEELPTNTKAYHFVRNLREARKRITAVTYMRGYERCWIPLGIFNDNGEQLWFNLYPSLNPTGTDTLRWSSSDPNEQNISKKEGFNLRYMFGPLPGREWWALDYENIELRIPAYEAEEEAMIELFEKPDEPPYFGSYHALNASIVYPELFLPLSQEKDAFKKEYKSTWYQYCKNGGFAIQYGCQEAKADATFKRKGAFKAIKEKMPKVAKLNDYYVRQAEKTGFVETIPDKSIGAKRGYPIYCSRTRWGGIKPTIPLNYHVQSTAMWATMKAMIRCHEYLQTLEDSHIVLQVHDEIVFDLPAGGKKNLPIVKKLKALMEKSGEDIDIPLKVSYAYHPSNWSEEVEL